MRTGHGVERRCLGSRIRRVAEHVLLALFIGLVSASILCAYLMAWPVFGIR